MGLRLRTAATLAATLSLASHDLFAAEQPSNPKSTGIICWTDTAGRQIGCGYAVPPEYANNPTRELNSRGLTVKKSEGSPTGDALRTRQEAEARRKAEEQELAAQRKRDLVLINSYSSESEIDARRDRDVQQLDLTIVGLQTSLKQLRSTELDLRRKVEVFSKSGKPAPEVLTEDLQRVAGEATDTERLISKKRNEQDSVRAKYNELRSRFSELMRQQAATK
jgi:hypothetical protein